MLWWLDVAQIHEDIYGIAVGNVDLSLLHLKQHFTFNSDGSKNCKKSLELVKILSSWNTTCLFSPKQDRLVFLKNRLHSRLNATPVKYMLVHRWKPLYVTFSWNGAEFATCFCLDLEITGITLTLPTKAAPICSLFCSVVDLAFLESIQLLFLYWLEATCVQQPRVTQQWQREVAFAWDEGDAEGPRCKWWFLACYMSISETWVGGKQLKNYQQQVLAYGFFLMYCSCW